MRVKELNNKLARIACSPYNVYPAYIAAATASEQSDLTIGINSTIDLLHLDLSNSNTDLEIVKSINIESRCSKLIWSENKTNSSLKAKNFLISGCEDTKIYIYDTDNSSINLIETLEKHQSGAIQTIDLNPFQTNLLASGAGASEIFIWDLNNPLVPMTPGSKQQPLDDVNCVAWNRQVQHILASTCSGKCVVWDLRKNESIIKISENMSKLKAKLVAWHPDIATQICLSSDDDHTPYLQLWDLRFATSPVRVLEGHHQGILNFSWSQMDSNLLISSAKDNRIICWNPNNVTTNGEILYDLPTSGQWCFDLAWSQRNPDLICTSSYEGIIYLKIVLNNINN
jgi:protein transport protein SEC31